MQLDNKPPNAPKEPRQKSRRPKMPRWWWALLVLSVGTAFTALALSKTTSTATENPNSPSTSRAAAPVSGENAGSGTENVSATSAVPPRYRTYELMQATVHVVSIPVGTPLSVAVADGLTTVKDFAQQEEAFVVLNAGFFDPQNAKTTSHLMTNGQSVGNPADNDRLTDNPDLQAYLPQILDRSEFRVYQCESSEALRYDITFHSTALPNKCEIVSAVGAGPRLLPENTSTVEAFTSYEDGELVRDAIGSVQPNARSAIALTADESLLLIMVAQRYDADGMTLVELSEFAEFLGATELLNLDGGSSSSLYFDGQTHFGRLDANGYPVERPVKSVIVVGK